MSLRRRRNASVKGNSLLEWLEGRYGPEIPEQRRREWAHFVCPYCGDIKGRFGVNLVHLGFRCFHCERRGSIKATVPSGVDRTLDLTRKDSKSVSLPPSIPGYQSYMDAGRGHPVVVEAIGGYFRDRGLLPTSMEWGVSSRADLSCRVVFPIRHRGQLVSYQARTLLKGVTPKTINGSTEDGWVNASRCLYNYDMQEEGGQIVVTEGPADAARVGGVALMGKELSMFQLRLLVMKRPCLVVVFLDEGAEGSAVKVVKKLWRAGLTVRVVQYGKDQTGDDPCSVSDPMAMVAKARPIDGVRDLVKLEINSGPSQS